MSEQRDIRFPIDNVCYPSHDAAQRYFHAGAWVHGTVGRALEQAAARWPNKTALVDDRRRLTFAEWNAESHCLASRLRDLGLLPGDRALFQTATISETAVALCACFKAGIVPVCAIPQHREIEIAHLSRQTTPKAHFVMGDGSTFDLPALAKRIAGAHQVTRHVIVVRGVPPSGTHGFEALSRPRPGTMTDAIDFRSHVGAEDVLAFQLSGGTTGVPKIIPRFHAEYLGSARAWTERIGLTSDDTLFWSVPLIHNAGQILALVPAILTGATLVLAQRPDAETFFGGVERERVTVAVTIGPLAVQILRFTNHEHYDRSSLRLYVSLNLAEAVERHLGVTSMNMFGMTEGLLMTSKPTDPPAARFYTVGYPVSPLDNVLVLSVGDESSVPLGEPGELAFNGPSRIQGYYGTAETISVLRGGYYRSGDIVRPHTIDGRTYYSFEGRLGDNIDRGGEKFGTEEIEALLSEHPDIVDAKIVAMPDPLYGEKGCAFVIVRRGRNLPSVTDIRRYLADRGLAAFKAPERLEPIDAFPLTPIGKVDKGELRRRAASPPSVD